MSPTITHPDDGQAQDELSFVIRERRNDCPPRETARQLLAHDQANHVHLVGINYDATRTALYNAHDHYVRALSFDPYGLADRGPKIAHFNDSCRFDIWIDVMAYYWGWLNPRFRDHS